MLKFTISGEQDSTTLKVLSLGKRLSPNPKGGTLSWAQTKSEHNKGRVLIQVNEPQTAVTGFSNVTPSWLWLMSVESNTHWKSAQLYATNIDTAQRTRCPLCCVPRPPAIPHRRFSRVQDCKTSMIPQVTCEPNGQIFFQLWAMERAAQDETCNPQTY